MIWGKTTDQMLKERYNTWHKWFAWYPVKLNNGRWLWWEWVVYKRSVSRSGEEKEYRRK